MVLFNHVSQWHLACHTSQYGKQCRNRSRILLLSRRGRTSHSEREMANGDLFHGVYVGKVRRVVEFTHL